MATWQWAVLALAALAVFWAVGAHNRLVALRNDIGQAWAQVDEACRQRGAALDALLAALREPMASEAGALDTLAATRAEAQQTAAALSQRPVSAEAAASWVRSEAALGAATTRVLALLDQQHELRAQPGPAQAMGAWREAQARIGFARQLYDAAAQAYDAAAVQRPTRWLLPLFGFGPAGRLGPPPQGRQRAPQA